MKFEMYLRSALRAHPATQPQDIVKHCYQAAFGAEHLLADPAAARAYLEGEYAQVEALDGPLYEALSEDICRVSLAAWKAANMPLDWLLNMFAASATVSEQGNTRFADYLRIAGQVVRQETVDFSLEQWERYLAAYRAAGVSPVHHSPKYRETEQPAYRIIHRRFLRILPVLQRICAMEPREPLVIAIDGRAASGKTTLAGLLHTVIGAEVIHMDDFFLPPALRTPLRLSQPGANVHYERFAQEVLPKLHCRQPFSYRIFDCGRMDYHGTAQAGAAPVRVVEGSYSCHPFFGAYADISVFSTISPEEQLRRIQIRNGAQMLQMFQSKWIPMEEQYFSCCKIPERADLVIDGNAIAADPIQP